MAFTSAARTNRKDSHRAGFSGEAGAFVVSRTNSPTAPIITDCPWFENRSVLVTRGSWFQVALTGTRDNENISMSELQCHMSRRARLGQSAQRLRQTAKYAHYFVLRHPIPEPQSILLALLIRIICSQSVEDMAAQLEQTLGECDHTYLGSGTAISHTELVVEGRGEKAQRKYSLSTSSRARPATRAGSA